jgi:hypothetical protein
MTDLFNYQTPAPARTYPAIPGHARDSGTSKAAAKSIEPHMGRLQQRVYDLIVAKPRTAWEIECDTGLRAQAITGRIRELTLAGKIEDSNERRETGSGRKAVVWRVKA